MSIAHPDKALIALGAARLQQLLLVLAFATSSWNAIAPGGLQLVDAFLACVTAVALTRFMALNWRPKLKPPPDVVNFLVLAIIAIATYRAFVPVASSYFAERFTVYPDVRNLDLPTRLSGNVVDGAKWVVSIVIIPILIALTGRGTRYLKLLAMAWLLGSFLSSSVAVLDFLGATSINLALAGSVDVGGREAGLTFQPVQLATSIAITLPFVHIMFMHGRRCAALGVVVLVVQFAGLLATGSRGGLVAGAIGFLLVGLLNRRSQTVSLLSATAGFVAGILALAFSSELSTLGLRLFSPGNTVDESDLGRVALATQGLRDFDSFPIAGLGLQVLNEAHSVPIQVVAAGGLTLAISFAFYVVHVLRASKFLQSGSLRATTLASVITFLGLGIVENQLTDRFLYVAIGVIVANEMTPRCSVSSNTVAASAGGRHRVEVTG